MEDISESSDTIETNDTFHFELGEELLIETGVVAVGNGSIIVHADQKTLDILSEHFILEDFEELTEAEVIPFPSAKRAAMQGPMGEITGKVYGFEKPEDLYAEFEKSNYFPANNATRSDWQNAAMSFVANKRKTDDMNVIRPLAAELYDQHLQLDEVSGDEELGKIMKYSGLDSPAHLRQKPKDWKDPTGNDPTPAWKRKLDAIAGGRASAELDALDDPSRTDEDDSTPITPNQTPVQNASDYQTKRKALQGLIGTTTDSNKKAELQGELASLDAEADEKGFATQTESKYPHVSMRMGSDSDASSAGSYKMGEAKYHGREVPLGKKMQGDVKKSKVYVRKPNGKVVKVNFGDKNMRIKKNIPSHRKSFRARHHCESPGPRWKARYWSCKSW